MTPSEFMNLSLGKLEQITGIDKSLWSRYFSGQTLSERTLNRISNAVEIDVETLFCLIRKRRQNYSPDDVTEDC
jgi:transcriptional regulator with XRE-family HTH domain